MALSRGKAPWRSRSGGAPPGSQPPQRQVRNKKGCRRLTSGDQHPVRELPRPAGGPRASGPPGLGT
jgi:hypothetical protein